MAYERMTLDMVAEWEKVCDTLKGRHKKRGGKRTIACVKQTGKWQKVSECPSKEDIELLICYNSRYVVVRGTRRKKAFLIWTPGEYIYLDAEVLAWRYPAEYEESGTDTAITESQNS